MDAATGELPLQPLEAVSSAKLLPGIPVMMGTNANDTLHSLFNTFSANKWPSNSTAVTETVLVSWLGNASGTLAEIYSLYGDPVGGTSKKAWVKRR